MAERVFQLREARQKTMSLWVNSLADQHHHHTGSGFNIEVTFLQSEFKYRVLGEKHQG